MYVSPGRTPVSPQKFPYFAADRKIGHLEQAISGEIVIGGRPISHYQDEDRADYPRAFAHFTLRRDVCYKAQ
jgi:hypothetical protein